MDALLVALALVLLVGGVFLLQQSRARRVVHTAELGMLRLRLESADWLHDDMLHPGTVPFGMPAAMVPGLPEEGAQRLHVELTVQNVGRAPQTFDLAELTLHAADGRVWKADSGPRTQRVLEPRHLFTAVVQFDVPEEEGRSPLTLQWAHAGEEARLLSTTVPRHEKPQRTAPEAWPATAEALPSGRATEGGILYRGRFACASCHGEPGSSGSNTVGPALDDFARVALRRVPDKGAAQYAYESILNPRAFLAPECARGQPCTSPSIMPPYGELMSLQDMADVIAFLMSQHVAQRQ